MLIRPVSVLVPFPLKLIINYRVSNAIEYDVGVEQRKREKVDND